MDYITKKTLNEKKNAVRIEANFFRVPKELLRSKRYRDLSPSAKLIYIELLDRVGLSIKNDWVDEKGRYYVKLSKESVPEALGVSSKTFDRCKPQLEEIGLIKIYKKNSRVHHIYVSLPVMAAIESGHYERNLYEISDFGDQNKIEEDQREVYAFLSEDGEIVSVKGFTLDGRNVDLVKEFGNKDMSNEKLVSNLRKQSKYKVIYQPEKELPGFLSRTS